MIRRAYALLCMACFSSALRVTKQLAIWLWDRIAWFTLGLLALVAVLRLVAHDETHWLIVVNMFTAYVYLPAYAIGFVALCRRKWRTLGAALSLVAFHLWFTLPGAIEAPLAASIVNAPRLRVMSANVLVDNPDKDGIVREVLENAPDVLLVQELSDPWERALAQPAVSERLPYRLVRVSDWPFGIGIYSRLPLDDAEIFDIDDFPTARATATLEGHSVRIYNVHTLPPRFSEWVKPWSDQLRGVLEAVRGERLPTIVGGDFNMTPYAKWYRAFTDAGLREVHDERGRGVATTWPNGMLPIPSIRLDHAFLSNELECISVREGEGRGSDHRPVIFETAL